MADEQPTSPWLKIAEAKQIAKCGARLLYREIAAGRLRSAHRCATRHPNSPRLDRRLADRVEHTDRGGPTRGFPSDRRARESMTVGVG